jgi:hypothetical protein
MCYLLSKIFKVRFGLMGMMGVLLLSACDPCRQLADAICACEKNVIAQENCRKALDMRANHHGFVMARDEKTCKQVLDTKSGCDCNAIQNNDYEKCGMTRPEK